MIVREQFYQVFIPSYFIKQVTTNKKPLDIEFNEIYKKILEYKYWWGVDKYDDVNNTPLSNNSLIFISKINDIIYDFIYMKKSIILNNILFLRTSEENLIYNDAYNYLNNLNEDNNNQCIETPLFEKFVNTGNTQFIFINEGFIRKLSHNKDEYKKFILECLGPMYDNGFKNTDLYNGLLKKLLSLSV